MSQENQPLPFKQPLEIRDLLNRSIMFILQSIQGASYRAIYNHVYGEHTTGNFLYPLLDTIIDELVEQGYIVKNERMSIDITKQDEAPFYFITYKGIRFCRQPILGYRSKPFHYIIFLQRLSILWRIVQVIGVIAISLATFYISYLTFLRQFGE